jgi:magnesium-transporting ATPase (P-type)
MLAEVAALANTSTLVPPLDRKKIRWTAVGDPTEAALLALSMKCGIDYKQEQARQKRLGLIPFESSRKMMTSVHLNDGQYIAFVKGASNEVLARSTEIRWGGEVVPLTPEMRA